jgi:hypothetical protein
MRTNAEVGMMIDELKPIVRALGLSIHHSSFIIHHS